MSETNKETTGKNALVVRGNALVAEPKLEELFYEWYLRGIESWDDIRYIGANNIERFISMLRGNEKSSSARIHSLRRKQNLLRGKSGEYFAKEAKKFDNPTFPEIEIRDDNWANEEEPMDAESINRKRGATTFNVCGWCKHVGGGTGRYDYIISGSCGLLDIDERELPAYLYNYIHDIKKVTFKTPCVLQVLPPEDFPLIVHAYKLGIDEEKKKRENIRNGIRKMQDILRNLPEEEQKKPYLMEMRPYDLFNYCDQVVVLIADYKNAIVKGEWASAKVIDGYRHHDGCVSYCFNFPVHNGEYLKGCGGGAGMSRPEILLKEEFDYLRTAYVEDPRFFMIWLANISMRDFSLEKFMDHLIFGKMAETPKGTTTTSCVTEVKTVEDALSVLNLLMEPKTKKEVRQIVRRQLMVFHPDRTNSLSESQRKYGEEVTKVIYDARDLLLKRIKK